MAAFAASAPKDSPDHDPVRPFAGPCGDHADERFGHVVRIGRVGRGEEAAQVVGERGREGGDVTVTVGATRVRRLLDGGVKFRRVGPRLEENDVDTELRQLVAVALRHGFDRVLGRAVQTEERQRHATEDGTDIDDQAGSGLAHRRERGARRSMDAKHV